MAGCGNARLEFALLTANGDESNRGDAEAPEHGRSSADANASPAPAVTDHMNTTSDAALLTDAPIAPIGAEPELLLDGVPLYSDYVRLTHQQWENSVVANLRLETPTGHLGSLTVDLASRYSNNESVLFVEGALAEDYQVAAADVAQRITSDSAALNRVSESREPADFIAEVGRRFYRRSLSSAERATYLSLFETGASLAPSGEDAFAAGAQLLIETWMQAPHFLYRVEHSEGLLDGYEVATRLAFFLTDTTPSDALLDAAEEGRLATKEDVTLAAEELLATARAEPVFRRFHDETFLLSRLQTLAFDASFGLTPEVHEQLQEAARLFFDRQLREQHGLREMLLTDVAFVNDQLAPLYGVAAPAGGGFEPVTVGPSRRGVFAQLPFLMLASANDTPNAFIRGDMLSSYVLCQPIPGHPGDVAITPAPQDNPMTNRQYSSQYVAASECDACHRYIDPFGFAFENFDGLGRERVLDHGFPVDTTGSYPFAPNLRFEDSTQLMGILAESRLAHACYAKQLTEFGLARWLDSRDAPLVAEVQALSAEQDASISELVTLIVGSNTFRSAGVSP